MKDEVVILGGARTPMCEYAGALSDISALELGAHAARAALERSAIDPATVDHVVMGNALQTSGDAIYGARHVALKAGLPVEVPCLTVNRLCGSGIQALVSAAQMIQLGEASCVVAGGMENMTQAPHVIRGARKGFKLGQGQLEDSLLVALLDTHCGLTMAGTAQNLAVSMGITREQADAFALVSQQRAAAAQSSGKLAEEIAPLEVAHKRGTIRIERDDHLRPDSSAAGLAKLPPAFGTDVVTAGNASGIVDGAAALVVAGARAAEKLGRNPWGRIVAWGIAGVEPKLMGIGPVPATRRALAAAGKKLEEMDLVEVNEAFSAQYLAVEHQLGLDRERVNVNGGAIALGHPLGATGARLVLTLLYELRRRGGGYGLATACIGGGQGIAMVVEAFG
ncbi:MAG TPA: acetyl-CoA C-acyltransferase [Acidobacteriota bacterium]